MTLAIHLRRHAEIEAKLCSLQDELRYWRKLTDKSPRLKRHQSQICLLEATFAGLLEEVSKSVAGRPIDAAVLDRGVAWENEILAAHSIWEVFRSKYALRQNELFRDYLAACDDLAWECYKPALSRFAAPGTVKAPPLVFLSSTWSPFAQSRDSNFQNEVRAPLGSSTSLTGDVFQSVLTRLPIPLVSLPWYQASYLPGTILIAHEIGHVVERDFDLGNCITKALGEARLQAPGVWGGWASEIFADVYGCLAMGPSFAGALIDLLATSVSIVESENRRGGRHPIRALRVALTLDVLRKTGYADESERLAASWRGTYKNPCAMSDLASDVGEVVDAVLRGPYHGTALTDVISLTPDATTMETIILAAVRGSSEWLKDQTDPRRLLAAAQRLHEEPQPGQSPQAFKLLVNQTIQKGANQYRGRHGEIVETKEELDAELNTMLSSAREQGRALRNFLATLTASDSSDQSAPLGLRES